MRKILLILILFFCFYQISWAAINISGTIGTLDGETLKLSIAGGTPTTTVTSSGAFTFSSVDAENSIFQIWLVGGHSGIVGKAATSNITGITITEGALSIGDVNEQIGTSFTGTEVSSAYYNDNDSPLEAYSGGFRYRDANAIIPEKVTYTGYIFRKSGTTGSLTVAGTATSNNCTLNDIMVSGTYTLNNGYVYGDITNTGTFTASSIQLHFEGSNVSHSGAGSLCLRAVSYASTVNFTGDVTLESLMFNNNPTLTFEHGKTYKLTESFYADGATIKSDSAGDRFTFEPDDDYTLNNINVKDSQTTSHNLIAYNSTNSGNTDYLEAAPHWVFTKNIQAFVLEH